MSAKTQKERNKLYFAYGSNMDDSQMNVRCRDHEMVGPARFDGHRFRINSRGVATVVPDPGAVVHGLVWSISGSDEASLDVYEGVAKGLYRKGQVRVVLADGEVAEALVYIASDSTAGGSWGEYLNRIIKAAKRHGLPPAYIKELERRKKKRKRRYTEEEEAYLARLMSHGMGRTRAEWYLNAMQTWTREDYREYTRVHLDMMDAGPEFYPEGKKD